MKIFKKISAKIANIQAQILLSLVYFSILPLFALLDKLFTKKSKANWSNWQIKPETLDDLKKQF